ncbi:hypothetical protein [Bremerella alba]|uniref:Uncharacterized protein n=1 Tax=Bremerella alba TaxID=980252 RepID=A0A7V8V895_9BACT|nr:hypothetical protein [Bremerella alba]MBA2116730.1 hypothetical protein [Bremerella alba]
MSDLKKLEATIRRGQKAFFDAARALLEIERRKLWQPQFASIVEYAAARFDFSGCDVSRYRNAGLVLENLADFEQLPSNEAQCRALACLKHKEPQVKVWQALLESGDSISARTIEETAQRLLNDEEDDEQPVEVEEARTAIHEVVTAVKFLQAAKDRVQSLDEVGRTSLIKQIEIVEAEIVQLRESLLPVSIAA